MKKLLFPLLATIMLTVASCSEEFDVAAPYKDVTVVYGFLDMNDTAHYVRIQKAFLDQNQSAVTMAKNADSSFFDNISVKVERYRVSGNNGYVDSIPLERVDLNAEGYVKQPGAFFDAPNYAYKFTDAIDPQFFYRLKVTNHVTGNVDSADALIIDSKRPAFGVLALDDSNINLDGMRFPSTLPGRHYDISITYNPPPNFSVQGLSTPAYIAQAVIGFNWVDSNTGTGTSVARSFDYNAGFLGLKGTNTEFEIDNVALYSAIRDGMGVAPDNVVRLLNKCQITVYLGTVDFEKYRQALLIQGNGLTGNEIAPIYTNVQGKDALGLFTSRAVKTGYIEIEGNTVDSLILSPYLQAVKIRGTVY